MADLKKIGMILVLIDGILSAIGGVMGLIFGSSDFPFGTGVGNNLFGIVLGSIITIIIGVVFIFLYLERITLPSDMILGIVVLVLSILFTTWLGIIAGILILVDIFM